MDPVFGGWAGSAAHQDDVAGDEFMTINISMLLDRLVQCKGQDIQDQRSVSHASSRQL